MSLKVNLDSKSEIFGKTADLGFHSVDDAVRAGLRLRPADLARLFGTSKQAVSAWIKKGRICLGADGRADPRDAVNQLMSTGDPARLRAVFLKPLTTELAYNRVKISQLEQALEVARDNEAFQESAVLDLMATAEAMPGIIEAAWPVLCGASDNAGLWALLSWIEAAHTYGLSKAGSVESYLPSALSSQEKGPGLDDSDMGNPVMIDDEEMHKIIPDDWDSLLVDPSMPICLKP